MSDNVQLPALGESVTEGTVTRWLKNVGDRVEQGATTTTDFRTSPGPRSRSGGGDPIRSNRNHAGFRNPSGPR